MSITRNNHYVPQWYQKGFHPESSNQLYYLDIDPKKIPLPDGSFKTLDAPRFKPTSISFCEKDLYTTFFGKHINDDIEQILFGRIDNIGAPAIQAFITDDSTAWHKHFSNLFEYLDSQKIRTPKGLDWIKNHYPKLNQIELMKEMQSIRQVHGTIWSEGVREIVSAENSSIKFILSDHPVTVYNHACPPEDIKCCYPNDPSIALVGTQTIFPLDMNHCLILSNYEYTKNPDTEDPIKKRTNARNFGNSLVRTDTFITSRLLAEDDVKKINYIIKARAHKHIAAAEKEWLYPEKDIKLNWSQLKEPLLPPKDKLWQYGGEMYTTYEDGSTRYQDAFGRTSPENTFLKKSDLGMELPPNDPCGCGSGKKYKKCCKNKDVSERPSWKELSIRERNLFFGESVISILGLDKNKTWDDVRKELSDEQVKDIHELYGVLWPLETDIISLLPKPDKSLRVLYTGIIDPRVIADIAISSTIYFDEIIIQNPFIHPDHVKVEFSPIHNPHQYKEQTLKNVHLLLSLLPSINEGYINFIPDPSVFDNHLLKQMLDMSKERSKENVDDERFKTDLQLMTRLHKDDRMRTIYMSSKDQQKSYISEAFSNPSEDEINILLDSFTKKKTEDPFALIQDNVYGEKGGQFTTLNLTPNFEISLFLAQLTGSIILTDSTFRWNEITTSQHKEAGMSIYNWDELTSCMNNFTYILNVNVESTFDLRSSGKLVKIRNVLKKIYSTIQHESQTSENKVLMEKLKKEYTEAHKIAMKELSEVSQDNYKFKFNYIIPKGGIVHNNVQRILLTSGSDKHLKNVPMAIFVELA